MKKSIVTLSLCCGLFCSVAMAQNTNTTTTTTTTSTSSSNANQMRFYYYPSSNVYYDPANKDYWYYDDTSSQWKSATELPSSLHLVQTGRVTVYHNDADVWKDNAEHLKKYKTKKNGTVKAKGNGKS